MSLHRALRLGLAVALSAAVSACAQGGGGRTMPADGSAGDAPAGDGAARDGGRDGGRDAGGDASAGDSGPGPIDAGADAGALDSGGGETDTGVPCAPTDRSLVIVEVMVASISGAGDRGEWFEVVNTALCSVDLTGMTIESPTSGGTIKTHTISGGIVRPGQFFVFALSGIAAENHDLPVDYVYGIGGGVDEVVLNNGADTITLRSGGTIVDEVAWPTGGFTYGRSRQFPGGADFAMNSNWAIWCDSTSAYTPGYFGTPGGPNGGC